jgi:hypothetical protein
VSGHRQAAVALHALGESDRSAILDELPAADQATLRGYLAELDALGFDREVTAAAGAAAPQPRVPGEPQERLQAASAAAVFAALASEPASLVAQVLNLRDWPWAGDVVQLFAAPKRDAIRAARARDSATAPARARFLLNALDQRIDDADIAPPRQHGLAAGVAALRARVSAWTR